MGKQQSPRNKDNSNEQSVLGPVLPISGAEDTDGIGSDDILSRFMELAGGKSAEILVIPTASGDQEAAAKKYIEAFTEQGAKSVDVLLVEQREDANGESAAEQIEGATGIFITGGNQSRLVELLNGTKAIEAIRRINEQGVIVAGTSAGASILASHMMLGDTGMAGDSGDAAARKGMVEMVAGFGLVKDAIIDQHFSERGRMGRLLSVYAANPGLLSIGLDEDTAVLISDSTLEALGSGMVTIIDGRDASSDYFEREIGEVLSVDQAHLSVLGPGRRFDLSTRTTLLDEEI